MDQNLNDEFELETFLDGRWGKVQLGRHYNFPCPRQDDGTDHGFMIEPIVWHFCRQRDKDHEDGVVYCTGKKKDGSTCGEKMPYKITRLRRRND